MAKKSSKKDMQCPTCTPAWRNFGLLALRVSVAAIFIPMGWMKLGDIGSVAGMLGELGFPLEMFFAYVLALVELVGGAAVLLGVLTQMAGFLLAVTMLVALLTAHTGGPYQEALLGIAMLGSTLALSGLGGGEWKLWKDCVCWMKKK